MDSEAPVSRMRPGRTIFWAIVLGAIVGAVVSKVMDRWPGAHAEGDSKAAAGLKQFTEQAETFRHAAKQIAPAVVNITIIQKVLVGAGGEEFFPFGRFYRRPRLKEGKRIAGIGSGFVLDAKNGYIMTNNHVVESGDEYLVRLADKRELSARLVGTDPQTDVAILQMKADDLTPATLGDSDHIEVGDWVLAAGNPFGMLEQTVTAGIISAKGRKGLGLSNYEDFLQTDAAINQGNSGGPLVDLNGHVIGVNTAIYSRTGGYQGIGFAIPINQASKIAQRLIKDGKIVRGWMGVQVRDVAPAEAKRLKLDENSGLVVEGVYEQSPADRAHLQPDDVLLELNGTKLQSGSSLRDLIADFPPSTRLKLKLLRAGEVRNVDVQLIPQPHNWGLNRE